ncbi:MAG: hypothetical protein MUE98_14090 [Rhodobacteraceae bacterium]|jgi:lambda repressor-like predicted transcriptional regulator|nr:hypothetical protein [Paracoccaceae bacterium]
MHDAVHRNATVRAAFVARGSSLHAWCRENGVDPHNARKALVGIWTGPKADELVRKIEAAAEGSE